MLRIYLQENVPTGAVASTIFGAWPAFPQLFLFSERPEGAPRYCVEYRDKDQGPDGTFPINLKKGPRLNRAISGFIRGHPRESAVRILKSVVNVRLSRPGHRRHWALRTHVAIAPTVGTALGFHGIGFADKR
jgi:hypothetical protein